MFLQFVYLFIRFYHHVLQFGYNREQTVVIEDLLVYCEYNSVMNIFTGSPLLYVFGLKENLHNQQTMQPPDRNDPPLYGTQS